MIFSKLILIIAFIFPIYKLSAQEHVCGNSLENDLLRQEKFLEVRNSIPQSAIDLLKNQRSAIYIPVSIHFVTDIYSEDMADPKLANILLCKLNTYFETYNIQFYMHATRPLTIYNQNQAFYEDGYNNMLTNSRHNTPNAMNIFIGKHSLYAAGYYTEHYDYIYILDRYIENPSNPLIDKTIVHEVGHFFTLLHTFKGWDGINYDVTYQGANAPRSINNRNVELKTRNPNYSNCHNAGDYLCDTPADYYSFRIHCNHNIQAHDPEGELLEPSSSNYMSYFSDLCITEFSNEQVNAIYANIIYRNWNNFSAPTIATYNTPIIQNNKPLHNEHLILTYNSMYFNWDKVDNTSFFIIEIYKIMEDSTSILIHKDFVVNTPFDFLENEYFFVLPESGNYTWSLTAVAADGCTISNKESFNFSTSINTPIGIENTVNNNIHELKVMPNPILAGDLINISIYSMKPIDAKLKIYTLDGRLIAQEYIALNSNENNITLESHGLIQGLYIVHLESELGIVYNKFIVK